MNIEELKDIKERLLMAFDLIEKSARAAEREKIAGDIKTLMEANPEDMKRAIEIYFSPGE